MGNIEFWYSATNGFLSVVQPKRLEDFFIAMEFNFTQPENVIINKLQQDWPQFVHYSMGYVVCLGIGLLLLLIMPITGCCMCCCRTCCGRCGSKLAPPGEKDKCKRVTYSTIVLMLSALSLLALVCAFIANGKIRVQTKQIDGALVGMSKGFTELDNYKNQTLDDMEGRLFDPLRTTNNNISNILTALPASASVALAERTKAEQPLSLLTNFAFNINRLKSNYESIQGLTASLAANGQRLESNLSDARSRIRQLLAGCSSIPCIKLRNTISNIVPNSNFSRVDVTNVQLATDTLDRVIQGRFPEMVNQSAMQFVHISDNIQRETGKHLGDVKNQMHRVTTAAEKQLRDVTDPIKNASVGIIGTILTQSAPTVDMVGEYVSLGLNVLMALLLLIVVLNILGILFGAVCQLPADDATCCNSRRGADCLLAGTGFTFIFYWLFILLTMGFFLSGGMVRNEVCRYATAEPEVNSSIQTIDKYLGDVFQTTLNLSNRFSLLGVVKKCGGHKSLYEALNVESFGINISKLLDLKEHGVDKMLDQVRNTSITIRPVNILTGGLNDSIHTLAIGLNDVNLTPFDTESKKSIVRGDLQTFIQNLEAVGDGNFINESQKLRNIQNTLISYMEQNRVNLASNVSSANKITSKAPLKKISANLTTSQETLNTEGDAILRGIINQTSLFIWDFLDGVTSRMADNVRNEIGRCRPVYNAFVQIVEPICVRVLHPFNALWFSFGTCLFLFIPMMIFSVKLAGLFRKVAYGHKVFPGPDRPLPMTPRKSKGRSIEAVNVLKAQEALNM